MAELNALDRVVRDWLKGSLTSEKQKSHFRKLWATSVVSLRRPPSLAKGYWFLQGDTGLTQRERGDIILANYIYRNNGSVGKAMVRWISCRLWSELLFEVPPGKPRVEKERRRFTNLIAGRYVLHRSKLKPTPKSFLETEQLKPTRFPTNKSANASRAIGDHLEVAVSNVLGKFWHQNPELLEAASSVLWGDIIISTENKIERNYDQHS